MKTKLYVASSWRNPHYEPALGALRAAGYECFDFKNPPEGTGFSRWPDVATGRDVSSPAGFVDVVDHPVVNAHFKSDFDAMKWADAFVLVLPCGRSAHLEAGWAAGAGKPCFVLLHEDKFEPELMYKLCTGIYANIDDMLADMAAHLLRAEGRGAAA